MDGAAAHLRRGDLEGRVKKGEVRIDYRTSAGSYSYAGPIRFALVRLWWIIVKHRFWLWWRRNGLVD